MMLSELLRLRGIDRVLVVSEDRLGFINHPRSRLRTAPVSPSGDL
jgi:hypothetical protein